MKVTINRLETTRIKHSNGGAIRVNIAYHLNCGRIYRRGTLRRQKKKLVLVQLGKVKLG